ncbi:hypothetical protein SHIRM173S_07846 [Streptomyces hirsutus]
MLGEALSALAGNDASSVLGAEELRTCGRC